MRTCNKPEIKTSQGNSLRMELLGSGWFEKKKKINYDM
jgi:hypothetical protein